MIYASGLTKRYGSFKALDDVSFEVNKGEIVGFLGPNGAGKSTTMRILTCFISPTGGVAKVRGHDVFDDTLAVRANLGYLPQRAPLYLEMTVYEYLEFASRIRNIDRSKFKQRARTVVEICGLAQSLSKEIRQLSHGYRQRVGLAQALIHDPPILILDEPTSDLDPNERSEFLNYLKQIGKDRTVLLSTHNLKEVEAACARAIIVSRGRVARRDPREERPCPLPRVDPGVDRRLAVPREGLAPASDRGRTGAQRIARREEGERAAHRRARACVRALR
jgi:ABC-2 type transport system ATP-binding protein